MHGCSLTRPAFRVHRYPQRRRAVVITGIGLVTAPGARPRVDLGGPPSGRIGARWLDRPAWSRATPGFPVPGRARCRADADPALDLLARAADEAMADAGWSVGLGARPRPARRS